MKYFITALTILFFSSTLALADGSGRYSKSGCHSHKTGKTYLHDKKGNKCETVPNSDLEKILKRVERKVDELSKKLENMPSSTKSTEKTVKEKICDGMNKAYETAYDWNRNSIFENMRKANCFN